MNYFNFKMKYLNFNDNSFEKSNSKPEKIFFIKIQLIYRALELFQERRFFFRLSTVISLAIVYCLLLNT